MNEFIASYYGSREFHEQSGSESYRDLIDWPALNSILRFHRLEWPRVRLSRNGAAVPLSEYTQEVVRRNGPPYRKLVPAHLQRTLSAGATLVLDRVDLLHEPVARAAYELERALGSPTFVNLYASWGGSSGFEMHCDDHDVIVVQIDGEKEWTVAGPTRKWPLHKDVKANPRPTGDDAHTLLMKPGSYLYLPHGWWHSARPTGGHSLHLTFGIDPSNGIDLLTWTVDRLRDDELLRQRLPLHASDSGRSRYLSEIRERVLRILNDPSLLDDFELHEIACGEATPEYSLPAMRPEGDTVRWLAPRAVLVPRSDGSGIVLHANRKRITLQPQAEVFLKELMDSGEISLDRSRSDEKYGISPQEMDTLLEELLKLGIVSAPD
ncbi:cupin domain-containing protein [Streptomyces sp. NPDC088196]|uniref:JmjC domain-containing protein n=1 Tax=Streptomyces sp. NPDC088196 TaxID=3154868 RepID=UPI003450B27D